MGSSLLQNALQTALDETKPSTNFDYQTAAYIRKPTGTGSTGEIRWLVYFARPFPLGATIQSAKLRIWSGAASQTGSLTLTAKRIKASVAFSRVTWATRPTSYYSGSASVTVTGPVANRTLFEIDVTAMMQSVALGDAWYGFELSTPNFAPAIVFHAPGHSSVDYRPQLEVVWSDAPSTPRTLAPSGGRAVSGAKPILRCDYVDVSGDVEMQAIQVQTSASTSFTSPSFDSGTVASSTPELDLSATAFAGLTDGQTIYWRVRVQDSAGLWSGWSDPVSFMRDSKGTLTLNNPSSGTPIVEDATPPIGWTFTGETQAAYQVTITETKTDTTVKTWTTGKISSTANEVTPPVGVISSPDSTYSVSVRVWDTKQRETIPNDPAYVEVVRAFTFVPSATVTATSSPTLTPAPPYPRHTLGWSRATDPDSFTVLRNRVVVAKDLIPNDVRVSGTQFAWVDRSAPPQTPLTYEVQAVVNGKASASNPTVTGTLLPLGIWLADEARTNEVWMMDKDEQSTVYGETSEFITIVGATERVLVTQALRGLEGTIKGTLHDTTTRGVALTAQAWRNKLLLIKAKAGQKCWLTLGDRTIQCVIANLAINRRPTSPLSFSVTFDFSQVGTLDYTPTL